MNSKSFFITFEGPEGSGKSTQARWVVQRLRRAGRRVLFLHDPGSTALGRALLHTTAPLSPMAEALLFIGGRVALVEKRIKPALAKGQMVVCDRFHDSTVVYQGFGGGLDVPWLDCLGRAAIGGVTPDLTIPLDVPTTLGFSRLRRHRDRMERKTRQFHQRVRRGCLQLAKRDPRRIIVVDATRSPRAVRERLETMIVYRVKSC